MKRTYHLPDLLWQKMIDYGYPSIRQLAAAADIECSSLAALMAEPGHCPYIKNCRKLCQTLDIDPDVLLRSMTNGWTPGTEE